MLRHRGDLAEAEALRRRVLEAEEAKLGGKHRNTLTALNNLAVVLWQQGKYEEAEALYCRALEGYEAQFGARHPVTLTSLNNLANLRRIGASTRRLNHFIAKCWKGWRLNLEPGILIPSSL